MSIGFAEEPMTADLPRERLAMGLTIGLVLCIGIASRVRVVQLSGGLVRDDAAVALSIVQRNEWELLSKPMLDEQEAPIGYRLVTKEFIRWLGDNETALRMPALVASILALVFYLILVRQVLPARGQVLGFALLAFSWPLAYFAGRVKPYSSDALAAIILLIAAIRAMRRPPTLGSFTTLTIVGIIGILFSFPATFVLAAIGLTLIARSAAAGRLRESIGWIAVSALWLAAFLALYVIVYRSAVNPEQTPWYDKAGAFAPFPPRSIAQLKWYYDSLLALFQLAAGLGVGELAGVVFLFGVCILAATGQRPLLGMLIIPLLLALAASALKKYPFIERLLLFGVPMLLTVIAAGLSAVSLTDRSTRILRRLLVAMLLLYPTYMTAKTLASGAIGSHDIKPALDHLAEGWQDGDMVYVHDGARTLYDYYVNVMNYKNLRGKPVVIGLIRGRRDGLSEYLTKYAKDLERVHGGKRVWFLFGMASPEYIPESEHILDAWGTRLDKFEAPTSGTLLYDLSRRRPDASGSKAWAPSVPARARRPDQSVSLATLKASSTMSSRLRVRSHPG
jgi:hypothetical protein